MLLAITITVLLLQVVRSTEGFSTVAKYSCNGCCFVIVVCYFEYDLISLIFLILVDTITSKQVNGIRSRTKPV